MAIEDVKFGRMKEVTLTGQFLPVYRSGQPVLLDLPQLGPSLALFGTVNELESYMALAGVREYSIKRVDDSSEFMKSQIPCPIVCNLRYEDGRSKWNLIMSENEA